MKTLQEFYDEFDSPLPNAILRKWPHGHIMQKWAENPLLYSQAFGRGDDFSKNVCGHSGIDMATFHRDKVCASHDGIVSNLRTDRNSLGGLIVYLDSPMLRNKDGRTVYVKTAYAHLDDFAVRAGQRVKKGDVLGYEGNTGFVISGGTPYWGNAPAGVGTHLHFGVYVFKANDQPLYPNCMNNSVDPLPIIMQDNPNYGGTLVLLENLASWLRKQLPKL